MKKGSDKGNQYEISSRWAKWSTSHFWKKKNFQGKRFAVHLVPMATWTMICDLFFFPSFFKIVWLWLNWSKFKCWREILFVIFMNFIYVFLVIILVSWFVGFQICVDQAGTTLLRILWKWNCNEIEYSRLNKLVRYPWKLPKRIENWWTVGREHPVSIKRLLLKDFANCILRVSQKNVIFKKCPRGLHCCSLIRFILQVLLIFQSMRACCWQFGYEKAKGLVRIFPIFFFAI